jgi:hypothetical protein
VDTVQLNKLTADSLGHDEIVGMSQLNSGYWAPNNAHLYCSRCLGLVYHGTNSPGDNEIFLNEIFISETKDKNGPRLVMHQNLVLFLCCVR